MAPTPLLKVGYNVHTRCMHLQMKPCAHDDEMYLRKEFEWSNVQVMTLRGNHFHLFTSPSMTSWDIGGITSLPKPSWIQTWEVIQWSCFWLWQVLIQGGGGRVENFKLQTSEGGMPQTLHKKLCFLDYLYTHIMIIVLLGTGSGKVPH